MSQRCRLRRYSTCWLLFLVFCLLIHSTPAYADWGTFVPYHPPYQYLPLDIKEHWAEKTLTLFIHDDIIKGYADAKGRVSVKPDQPITRAEFVSILMRILQIYPLAEKPIDPGFLDIHPEDWYYGEVCNAAYFGIAKGVSSDEFAPNKNITREEIVSMVVRSFSNTVNFEGKPKQFTDLADDWGKPSIDKASSVGIINGYTDGTFRPKTLASRAEAMVMISQALKLEQTILPDDKLLTDLVLNCINKEYFEICRREYDDVQPAISDYTTGFFNADENWTARQLDVIRLHIRSLDITQDGVASAEVISKTDRLAVVNVTGLRVKVKITAAPWELYDPDKYGKVNPIVIYKEYDLSGNYYLSGQHTYWRIYSSDKPEFPIPTDIMID